MPHGTPDWGLVGPKSTVFGLDDLGEHAVRLGSPHLFDRRGDVLWMTDFRNGRGDVWDVNVPANGEAGLYAGYARQGGFCVRLMANLGVMVGLRKLLPLPVTSWLGLEFSFSLAASTAFVGGQILTDNGVHTEVGAVRYDPTNDLLQYLVDPTVPTWTTFAGDLNLWEIEYCPNTLKLVVNVALTPPEYVRAIVNDITYSLAGIPLYPGLTTGVAFMWGQIEHTADATGAAEISVDNVVVTQNEP